MSVITKSTGKPRITQTNPFDDCELRHIKEKIINRYFMEAGNELKNDNDISGFLQYGSD